MMKINRVICGDAIIELLKLPENSIDSIVTDPPAGISFMGMKWDTFGKGNRGDSCRKTGSGNECKSPGFAKDVHWDKDKEARDKFIQFIMKVMSEGLRVLKPGGHALVWALPRTSHWTGFALENAGFEVRDVVHHVFGSGFPKSLDISKQIDKQAGAEREIIGQRQDILTKQAKDLREGKRKIVDSLNAGAPERNNGFVTVSADITAPSTEEAKQWSGWGTALKPAVECWWLVRKPLSEKTVAQNILKWGTGGLNIDGCRVGTKEDMNPDDFDDTRRSSPKFSGKYNNGKIGQYLNRRGNTPNGRFPANLIHDGSDEVIALFPQSKGQQGDVKGTEQSHTGDDNTHCYGEYKRVATAKRGDGGSAARFFYCAKPSKSEREDGVESNNHPTVKAQALMQYLIKLITPPSGIVLDMFAGSGSTLVAAKKLKHPYIGIEIDPEYCKIAEKRLIADLKGNSSLDAFSQ